MDASPACSFNPLCIIVSTTGMLFVFAALMEFALVNVLSRKRPPTDRKDDLDELDPVSQLALWSVVGILDSCLGIDCHMAEC